MCDSIKKKINYRKLSQFQSKNKKRKKWNEKKYKN